MTKFTEKKITVYFFTLQANTLSEYTTISVFDFFKKEFIDKNIELSKSIELGENKFQLRNISSLTSNNSLNNTIGGSLTRLRDDVPPIGAADTAVEREVKLDDNEGFLEKSHFVISKESNGRELISFQYSIEAGTINTLGKVLQQLITYANEVEILAIIRKDAMKRMMQGEIQHVEYVVAKPKIKDYVAEDDFTKGALELMDDTNAIRFQGKLSIGNRKKGICENAKNWISKMVKQPGTTKKLKVKLKGISLPIDILGDQVKEKIQVKITNARRPETKDVLEAILRCKSKMYEHIRDAIDI